MDLLFAQHKSLWGNALLHCITNGKCSRAFPMADKSFQTAEDCLSNFLMMLVSHKSFGLTGPRSIRIVTLLSEWFATSVGSIYG